MRTNFNDGQEIVYGDLNKIAPRLMMELHDRVLYELMQRQQNVLFGDSLKVSYVNATTVQVLAGNGMQYDSSQVDPEPKTRPLYLAANTNKTLAAADGSNNRIDIVSVKANVANATSETRNFKDASTLVVTPTSMVTEIDWASDLLVTTGTPAGSPAVPSTPAGYIKLAEILVTAAVGLTGASNVTDKRPRYGANKTSIVSKSAAYTVDLDDGTILVDATAGAVTITLPAASLCSGKTFHIKKVDSSLNAVTIACAGSDLLDGSASQDLANQYTAASVKGNGSAFYMF